MRKYSSQQQSFDKPRRFSLPAFLPGAPFFQQTDGAQQNARRWRAFSSAVHNYSSVFPPFAGKLKLARFISLPIYGDKVDETNLSDELFILFVSDFAENDKAMLDIAQAITFSYRFWYMNLTHFLRSS